jgi:hypothetical protein
VVWVHIAVHLLHALTKERAKPAPARRPVTRPKDRGGPPEDEDTQAALPFAARWEPADGARHVHLTAGGGQAWIVLVHAEADADAENPSDAVIGTTDRASGAAFVTAVARWLHRPTPPAVKRPSGLEPFAMKWCRVCAIEDGERVALAFAFRNRAAAVYLDVGNAKPWARFVECDPQARTDLVAILAMALRDGPPAAADDADHSGGGPG